MISFNDRRILFYIPGNDVMASGVYHTQVLGLAQFMVRSGAQCVVLQTNKDGGGFCERIVAGVRIWHCPKIPGHWLLPLVPVKLRRMVKPLEKRIFAFAPTHVYARDSYAGVAAIPLVRRLGARYVFSVRGAGLAKSDRGVVVILKEALLRILSWRVFHSVDHLSFVCQTLRDYVRKYYFYRGDDSIFPGSAAEDKFADVSKEEISACRKELSIPDNARVVIYSGSIGWYQNLDAIVALMKSMHALDDSLVFLFLVRDKEGVDAIAKRTGLDEACYRTYFSEPKDVGRYLKVATAAFALRTDDTITRLASPIKVGEYLASGLGVIVNPWIGDMRRIFGNASCAMLYDGTQSAEDIVKFVRSMDDGKRSEARSLGRRYYSYEGNIAAIEKMFS